jgi:hypothetical protein
MTITYKWRVSQLDRKVSNGFVTAAHWRANAIDGAYEASTHSSCLWTEGTPEIAYDDLTEEIVLGWVWANGVDKAATEAALAKQIEAQKAPVKASGLPWAITAQPA